MANEIGWGKAHENNIGYGQGGTNDIGYGSIYPLSYTGETVIGGESVAADTPFQLFQTRAEAEGFTVESHDCIINTTL
jgi:hypothetical protein